MSQPYGNALIFSGGGFRAGYYLGMYEALCELDKKPDIILASCGGSIMAAILSLCPEPKMAKQLLFSRAYYQMIHRVQTQPPTHRTALVSAAIKRFVADKLVKNTFFSFNKKTKVLPWSIFDEFAEKSLFCIENERADNPFWQGEALLAELEESLGQLEKLEHLEKSEKLGQDDNRAKQPAIVIVSSRSVPKEQGFVWQQVLSTNNAETLAKLEHAFTKRTAECSAPFTAPKFIVPKFIAPSSRLSAFIEPELHLTADMSLASAVRASINDMFYLPPLQDEADNYLLGGVIDLFPIEIAYELADNIYVEKKSAYDAYLAEPAIQSAFGFSANARQDSCHDFMADKENITIIDTSDNSSQIEPMIKRQMKLVSGYIDVQHHSYAEYRQIIKEQYHYGYSRVMQACGSEKQDTAKGSNIQ